MNRVNLLRWPTVRAIVRSRWPQLSLQLLALAGLGMLIVIGLVGTPVGNRNLAIAAIWIAWWAVLMLLAVPFLGRGWCSICPLPLPGEWLQRGAILRPPAVRDEQAAGPRGRYRNGALGLGLPWPKRLRNLWLQNVVFLALALASLSVLTQPRTTAWVLMVLAVSAVAVSLLFERRSFCRYLCPVGGVIGLYSQASPVEVRVIDQALCTRHTEKTCFTGNSEGYGCPWQVFPAALRTNVSCGTCLECLRTCPYDNVAVNIRPFGDDLLRAERPSLDQSFKSLLLLGSVVVYAAVMLGPWGALKSAAANVGASEWFAYAAGFLLVTVIATPGLFWMAASLGRAAAHLRARPLEVVRAFTPALIPLGMAAWASFSLSFLLTNLSYLWPSLSDPLSAGWNLLGTASLAWGPYVSGISPWLQVAILLVGVAWAAAHVRRIADRLGGGLRLAIPVLAFNLIPAVGLLWIFVG